jgi:hypothetical protein
MIDMPNCAYIAFRLRWKLVLFLGDRHDDPHINAS